MRYRNYGISRGRVRAGCSMTLHDGELNFLRDWPDVAGIWPIGKGLAIGFIRWRAAPLDL
jgi:hypothetical protein